MSGRTLIVTIAAMIAISASTAVNSTREKADRFLQPAERRAGCAGRPLCPDGMKRPAPPALRGGWCRLESLHHNVCSEDIGGLQQGENGRQADEADQRDQAQDEQRF